MSLLEHMCPVCDYYMPLATKAASTKGGDLARVCKNCGNVEDEKKGLVMEVIVQEKASESYNVFVNEFTEQDPRLPHISILKCPNATGCPSRTNPSVKPDIIYLKYDAANMKFLYICTHCHTQWKSRS
jgi:DNA-directed RNA polymerase subunit M/transcription elongation factor TFIIS